MICHAHNFHNISFLRLYPSPSIYNNKTTPLHKILIIENKMKIRCSFTFTNLKEHVFKKNHIITFYHSNLYNNFFFNFISLEEI